ncbi:SUMO-activating enzyme subunit 1, partial [Coemansia spiralis]|uniref:Ubiquitin-like 1-activating enzyme E1A n=2 Tax=Coemansia TaxID=4863 RepID=A0ABQ8PDJ7_9FUNG
MAGNKHEKISKEEVALYDRQIRLWGVEAQTRLRNSTICVIGVSTVTLEACKNLVLAGLGRIHLWDPRPIEEADLETQYYFDRSDLGKAKDQKLAEKLAILNPLVEISSGGHEEARWASNFDLVVAVGNTEGLPCMDYVNKMCRAEGTKFIAADAFGLFGYIFADCLERHEYLEEVKDEDDKEAGRRVQYADYKPLEKSCTANLGITNTKRLMRRYPPLVFVCQALTSSSNKNGEELTETRLSGMVKQSLQGRGIPDSIVEQALVGRVAASWGTEFVPCAAVIGGTLAQEVLKVATRKDMPVNNWFIYDAITGDGIQCSL